ncbi:MAG: hypothetical protein QUT30_14030 [Acidobacteriota bacterium]|nr:hypothetical protein [Acidobacteriota bacterium]
MADLAGIHGTRKEFRAVGKPNLPGVLSWSQATGVAKFGVDYVYPVCSTPGFSEVAVRMPASKSSVLRKQKPQRDRQVGRTAGDARQGSQSPRQSIKPSPVSR